MIEVTSKTIDGVSFIDKVRILEYDGKYLGIPVYHVSLESAKQLPLKAIGLKKWAYNVDYQADFYTTRWWFVLAKPTLWLWHLYWTVIRLLYDNARFFKEIPSSQPFSWKYFTPYVWVKKVRKIRDLVDGNQD